MNPTTVEQVARAIEEECAGCDPRNFGAFMDAARAAITAMREPSEAMVIAGIRAYADNPAIIIEAVWRTMIDAALAPGGHFAGVGKPGCCRIRGGCNEQE